jgi:ATP-dependent helicase HrpB
LADRIARLVGGERTLNDEARAGVILAHAFPDRVAKQRGGGFVMANGRAASLDAAEPLSQAPFAVIGDVAGAAGRSQVLLAAPISRDEIETMFADQIETHAALTTSADGAVRGRRIRRLGRVVLSETPLEKLNGEELEDALLEAVR